MPYGYDPAQFVPSYSGLRQAGQSIATGIQQAGAAVGSYVENRQKVVQSRDATLQLLSETKNAYVQKMKDDLGYTDAQAQAKVDHAFGSIRDITGKDTETVIKRIEIAGNALNNSMKKASRDIGVSDVQRAQQPEFAQATEPVPAPGRAGELGLTASAPTGVPTEQQVRPGAATQEEVIGRTAGLTPEQREAGGLGALPTRKELVGEQQKWAQLHQQEEKMGDERIKNWRSAITSSDKISGLYNVRDEVDASVDQTKGKIKALEAIRKKGGVADAKTIGEAQQAGLSDWEMRRENIPQTMERLVKEQAREEAMIKFFDERMKEMKDVEKQKAEANLIRATKPKTPTPKTPATIERDYKNALYKALKERFGKDIAVTEGAYGIDVNYVRPGSEAAETLGDMVKQYEFAIKHLPANAKAYFELDVVKNSMGNIPSKNTTSGFGGVDLAGANPGTTSSGGRYTAKEITE